MAKKPSAKQLAWRAKFARMYGGKKSKGSPSRSHSSGGGKVSNGNGKKQGIVSWVTSVIALVIGLSPVISITNEARQVAPGYRAQRWINRMMCAYTGYDPEGHTWIPARVIEGYAPIAGAVAFKKGTSYLVKTAKIKSLIPRIG